MHQAQKSLLPRLMLLLVLSVAALIQLTVVSRTTVSVPLRADAGEYFSYAYNLRHSGVYSMDRTWAEAPAGHVPAPDAFRPPGYPLFLAMLGTPEPSEAYLFQVSLAQALLGIASVWLLFLIASRFLGWKSSMAVALIAALSPHLATISTYLLSESLFYFLLLAAIASLLKAVDSGNRAWFAITGALWGLCSLVRSTSEFFPPLLLIAVLLLPGLRRFRSSAMLAFAVFAAVLAPWMIRNQSDSVAKPQSSLMVKALMHGAYPDFMYEGQPESFGFPYRFDPDSEKTARDLPSVLGYISGRFKAKPLAYAKWYLIGKPAFFLSWGNVQGWDIFIYPSPHSPYLEDARFALIRAISFLLHWPLMILGLIGSMLLWARPRSLALEPSALGAARLVALVVLYALAFHMIVAPFPRYGIPFRPLLYALAMLSLGALWQRWRPGRGQATP